MSIQKKSLRFRPLAVPVNEAHLLVGIGRTKLYELMATGRLESVKIGRRRLVLVASLERLVAQEPEREP